MNTRQQRKKAAVPVSETSAKPKVEKPLHHNPHIATRRAREKGRK